MMLNNQGSSTGNDFYSFLKKYKSSNSAEISELLKYHLATGLGKTVSVSEGASHVLEVKNN